MMSRFSKPQRISQILSQVTIAILIFSAGCTQTADDADTATDDISEAFSDTLLMSVSGTDATNCTVTGDQGVERGSGGPADITYEVGTEDFVTVHCDELAARVAVGTQDVVLTSETTAEADLFGELTHVPGTALAASIITDLAAQAATEEADLMSGASLTRYFSGGLYASSSVVAGSLTDFMTTLDQLIGGVDITHRNTQIIKLLINMGVPVVIENVGSGQTIAACTDAEAASFSTNAVSADAATVGLSGCLVYHQLYALTDLNNPAGVPQTNNIPESMRALATESGVVAELVNSFVDGRTFATSSLLTYLYTSVNYSGYLEDDEGSITTREPTEAEIKDYFAAFIGTNIDDWDPSAERFHTGYNPSGGWTFDTIAESFSDTAPWNAACYDSSGDTLGDCPVDAIRFDFDGTTLTQNDAGDYVLQLRYESTGYTTTPKVVEFATSRPYRDANYQPVTVDFDPSSYNTRYLVNELHSDGLDPMSDGTSSAPYSNATWRALYPSMSLVDNAYQHGATEVSARMAVILNTISATTTFDKMSALQVFALGRMMVGAMAALPDADGTDIIPVDHEMTVANWESATQTWLAAGTVVANTVGTGQVKFSSTNITFSGSPKCTPSATNVKVTCKFKRNSFKYSQTASETRANGDVTYALTGNFTVEATGFGGPYTYTPTFLVINSAGSKGWFEGDNDCTYSFNGQNLNTKITAGTSTQMTASYKLLAQ